MLNILVESYAMKAGKIIENFEKVRLEGDSITIDEDDREPTDDVPDEI